LCNSGLQEYILDNFRLQNSDYLFQNIVLNWLWSVMIGTLVISYIRSERRNYGNVGKKTQTQPKIKRKKNYANLHEPAIDQKGKPFQLP